MNNNILKVIPCVENRNINVDTDKQYHIILIYAVQCFSKIQMFKYLTSNERSF